MKLKQKLLLALVASILATPTAFAAYDGDAALDENTDAGADDARDYQNVTVNVPEIALIDVSATAGPTFTFGDIADAGSGFTIPAADTTSKLKYSSNVADASTNFRNIELSLGATDNKLPENLVLEVTPQGTPVVAGGTFATCILTGGADGTVAFSGCPSNKNIVAAIKNYASNSDAATGFGIKYEPKLKTGASMIGHTGGADKTLKLIYTMTTQQ